MTCINDNQLENETDRKVCEEKNDVDVSVGDFIVVQYDDIGYSGKVINLNNNVKTVRVILLKKYEKVKRKFKWLANIGSNLMNCCEGECSSCNKYR